MKAIDTLRNKLIDNILATDNERLLIAINSIFESTGVGGDIKLSSEQIEMLQISEKDIINGDVVSEEELNKNDEEWL